MDEALKDSESPSPAIEEENWTARDIILVIAAFALIVLLATGGFLYYQSTKPPTVTEGMQAPDFTYPVFGGGEATLSSFRGKVVLVNIWNTTCLECKKEMPLMEKEYQSLKNKPFEILAVSTDKDGATVIEPFVKKLVDENGVPIKLTFPVLMDTKNEVGSTYQTVRYPESFIVDREGKVAKIIIGRLTADDFLLINYLIES
ncbi:MAG: TlpA disulfide reductase family protein [Thermoleophilia bacterium]